MVVVAVDADDGRNLHLMLMVQVAAAPQLHDVPCYQKGWAAYQLIYQELSL